MKRGLYAIYDQVAGAILGDMAHFFARDEPAVRFFGDVVSTPNTPLAQHPNDYALICIADVDIESGDVCPAEGPDRNKLYAPAHRVVITGAQWQAAQVPREAAEENR